MVRAVLVELSPPVVPELEVVMPPLVVVAGVTVAGVTVAGVTVAGVTVVGVTVPGVTVPGVTVPGVTVVGVTVVGVTVVGVTVGGVVVVVGASQSAVVIVLVSSVTPFQGQRPSSSVAPVCSWIDCSARMFPTKRCAPRSSPSWPPASRRCRAGLRR